MKIHRSMEKIKEGAMGLETPMYVYATEMVSSYYSKIDVRDKKVLTVCGSGDQVLNAYSYGASEVVGFDLNGWSRHILELKRGAILQLRYEEFLDFFGEHEVGSFDYGLYQRLRESLGKETRLFFDEAYESCGGDGGQLVRSQFFRQRSDFGRSDSKQVNAYLEDERAYLALRASLDEPVFVQSDVKDVAQNFTGCSFDVINLSNVPGYFVHTIRDLPDPDRTFFDEVLVPLGGLLAPGGKMFYYSYSPAIYPNRLAPKMPSVTRNSTVARFKDREEFEISQMRVKGYSKETLDKIIVLERACC